MEAEVVDMWADALDSGDYDQTTEQIVSPPGVDEHVKFCCLGVLGKLLGGEVTVKEFAGRKFSEMRLNGGKLRGDGTFDNDAGVGGLTYHFLRNYASLNDEQGYTFPEIAVVIREDKKRLMELDNQVA